ncbi:hypothetical protein VMCG_07552 [Cytospora schulzeri]|uniref:FAD-binding domain-containing protein n=1 Tax=Cytospora schulzeri TaxID=448051 RepID=A0A423VX42_9PEZI|nr:hypothetical protein VMCG_07552 [Valsa malicola]
MADPDRKPFDVAIIGGGIAGVTLAIALQKGGIRCTIFEQAAGLGEISASISISRNAINAMENIDRSVLGALNLVSTHNKWSSKRGVWFDFMDGMSQQPAQELQPLFSMIDANVGQKTVHRAEFLEELFKLLPRDAVKFEKRLSHILDDTIGSGKMLMKFEDGSVAEADAIIGCDGVKSRTREIIVGEDHPAAKPSYTNKYAYRAHVPMERAVQALGEERATNASLWMGQNRHVLTFPMDQGAIMSLMAFVTNDREEWPSTTSLTLPTTKAEALDDFRKFGRNVKDILELADNNLDRWAVFDLGDHRLSSYYKGRICLVGDAAHATSPHHGAGAGCCIEDAAVLASLLADEQVKGVKGLAAAFAVYDTHRRERTQWLVQSSRRAGNLVEFLTADVGQDVGRIEKELNARLGQVWNFNIEDLIREAKKDLHRRLDVPGVHRLDSQEMPFFTNEQDGLETQ